MSGKQKVQNVPLGKELVSLEVERFLLIAKALSLQCPVSRLPVCVVALCTELYLCIEFFFSISRDFTSNHEQILDFTNLALIMTGSCGNVKSTAVVVTCLFIFRFIFL